MKKKIYRLLVLALGLVLGSCRGFLEVNPPRDAVSPGQLFQNDEIATSTITGIYFRMMNTAAFSGNRGSVQTLAGLSADELKSYSTANDAFYDHTLLATNPDVGSLWSNGYLNIYTANAVLEGLEKSTGVSGAVKRQLRGEAYFIRAFCYFYLTGLFGDVPLHLGTDQLENRDRGRTSEAEVMAKVVSDLLLAEELLSADFVTVERVSVCSAENGHSISGQSGQPLSCHE